MQSSFGELSDLTPEVSVSCVLESIDDTQWLVIYDQEKRLPVIEASLIPATFDGAARFNISNAMHAVTACYLEGVNAETLANAMSDFRAGYESTPGRMNVFDGLPFQIVMDYAHNFDGINRITEFVDAYPVKGRKILMVGGSGDRLDDNIRSSVTPCAGHFDYYICRNYRNLAGRQTHEIPALLKSGLLSAGVDETAICVICQAEEAVHHALAIAVPGDLVVLLIGSSEFQSVWTLLGTMAETSDILPG
jgi:cyanophycin synthetase